MGSTLEITGEITGELAWDVISYAFRRYLHKL